MAKKHAIIFVGEHEQLAQSIAGSYLRLKQGILPVSDSFTAEMDNNVNRMFGLLFSPEYYKDRGDVLLPDFYGYTQEQVFDDFKALMVRYGGDGVFGRVTGRRIRFNTAYNTFVFGGCPNKETLLALRHEASVGTKNMLIVFINRQHFFENHELVQVKDATLRSIHVEDDKELLALLVKGCIKGFFSDISAEW